MSPTDNGKAMKDEPAFPHAQTVVGSSGYVLDNNTFDGLTKREYFAGLAMQGAMAALAHSNDTRITDDKIARRSVDIADALIIALDKDKQDTEVRRANQT